METTDSQSTFDCLSTGVLVADHLCSPIDHVPAAGELVLADSLPLAIGGCAANAAMDLARLGRKTGVLGCVGQDAFGRFIIETLAERGIDVAGIQQRAEAGTSGTLIINVAGQDRRFVHSIGANGLFRAEEIPFDLVRRARVFYVGGYLLLSECRQQPLMELFRAARQSGVKTVLDVVLPGPGEYWHKLKDLLSETDVFLPNDHEAAVITGVKNPVEQAERFLNAGAGAAVITCGGDGTILMTSSLRLRAGVYPTQFVGGTGAGDAFDAGYIAGLLAGEDPVGCLRWGSALGASCVRAIGATESVFTRDEALEFMAANELPLSDV